MAIFQNYCDECSHADVCKIKDKLDAFHSDAKKPLGVDITIESCSSFTKEEEVE